MRQPVTLTGKPAARRRTCKLLALALPAGASSTDGGWFGQHSGSTAFLYTVAFSDADRGWAVGRDGVILATTSGDATWSAQNFRVTSRLRAVAFSDATPDWAAREGGTELTVHGEGGRTRVVLLPLHVAAQSETLRGEAVAEAPVFVGRHGAPLTSSQAYRILKAAGARAGLPVLSPHWRAMLAPPAPLSAAPRCRPCALLWGMLA